MEPTAHMLSRDADLLRDFSLPVERYAAITAPVLVLDGGSIPWLSQGLQALVAAVPNAELRTMPGQDHGIRPDVLAGAVSDFRGARLKQAARAASAQAGDRPLRHCSRH